MPNKLSPKSIPTHTQMHKEFYESKLEMMICGCGNRRELTIQEQVDFGIIISSNYIMSLHDINTIQSVRKHK